MFRMKLNGHKLYDEYISTDINSILEGDHFALDPWVLASVYDDLYEQDDGGLLKDFYNELTGRWQNLHGSKMNPMPHSFKGGLYYGAVFEDVLRDMGDDSGGKYEVLKSMDETQLYELTTSRLRAAKDDGEVARFFRQNVKDFDREAAVRNYGVDR